MCFLSNSIKQYGTIAGGQSVTSFETYTAKGWLLNRRGHCFQSEESDVCHKNLRSQWSENRPSSAVNLVLSYWLPQVPRTIMKPFGAISKHYPFSVVFLKSWRERFFFSFFCSSVKGKSTSSHILFETPKCLNRCVNLSTIQLCWPPSSLKRSALELLASPLGTFYNVHDVLSQPEGTHAVLVSLPEWIDISTSCTHAHVHMYVCISVHFLL